MKPRSKYRSRPKKSGAKKRQKVLSQKRRLEASGHEKKRLDKMTSVEVRTLLKETGRKKALSSPKKSRRARAAGSKRRKVKER